MKLHAGYGGQPWALSWWAGKVTDGLTEDERAQLSGFLIDVKTAILDHLDEHGERHKCPPST